MLISKLVNCTRGLAGTTLSLIAVVGSSEAASQAAATVQGIVIDSTSRPIANAIVSIGDLEVAANSNGSFILRNLRPGQLNLRVRAIGFLAASAVLNVRAGETFDTEIVLDRVTALGTREVRAMSPERAEFEERRTRNLGYVFDSVQLNRRSDLFSVFSNLPLVRVKRSETGGVEMSVRSLSSRRRCEPAAFVDGKLSDIHLVTNLPPNHFRAIEVLPYELVPAKYFTQRCVGAVLFWTQQAKW